MRNYEFTIPSEVKGFPQTLLKNHEDNAATKKQRQRRISCPRSKTHEWPAPVIRCLSNESDRGRWGKEADCESNDVVCGGSRRKSTRTGEWCLQRLNRNIFHATKFQGNESTSLSGHCSGETSPLISYSSDNYFMQWTIFLTYSIQGKEADCESNDIVCSGC